MAQDTQYCNFRYILGTVYSANTEASEISPGRSVLAEMDHGELGERWAGFVAVAVSKIRTDCRRLNHIADGEPLDGLVLGRASRAVGAPDGLDVAAACEVLSQSICESDDAGKGYQC